MPKALFLLIPCLVLHLRAQNNLRIFDAGGDPFKLFINDSLCNKNPENQVQVNGVMRDSIQVKTEFANGTCEKMLVLLDKRKKTAGKEFLFRINRQGGKCGIWFDGIYELQTAHALTVPDQPVVDTSHKYDNKVLEHYAELKERKVSYFNNYPYDEKCKVAMPGSYLDHMRMLIKRTQTDDEIYLVADNTVRNNCLNVSQLKIILSYIPYEIEKLRLIRTAYFSLIDPANSPQLESAFKLEASKKAMNDFLANTEHYRYNKGSVCSAPSDSIEINSLILKMKSMSADLERLNWLKSKNTSYCYSVKQCKDILWIFIHDKERIEAAKHIYFRCTEKEKFKEVKETFSYQESWAQLQSFIEKQK